MGEIIERSAEIPVSVPLRSRAATTRWSALSALLLVGAALLAPTVGGSAAPTPALDTGGIIGAGQATDGDGPASSRSTTAGDVPADVDGGGMVPGSDGGDSGAVLTVEAHDVEDPGNRPGTGECVESRDPACGGMTWTVEPVGTLATASWRLEPPAPAAGEPFQLVISWVDSEASTSLTESWCMPNPDGSFSLCADGIVPPCAHHGLWAPAPPVGGNGESRFPMTLPAGEHVFDWSATLGTTADCEAPDPWREAVYTAGSFVVRAVAVEHESLEPGRYPEAADNGSYAVVDGGGGSGSAMQLTRGDRRVTFHVFLHCPTSGRDCAVDVWLANTSGRAIEFNPYLAATVTVGLCDGSGELVTIEVTDSTVTGLAPGASVGAAAPVQLPAAGQWCTGGTVTIELR